MSISGKDAVRIARAHGLDAPTAAALRSLADTEAEAEELAAEFAAPEGEALADQIQRRAGRS